MVITESIAVGFAFGFLLGVTVARVCLYFELRRMTRSLRTVVGRQAVYMRKRGNW